MKKIYCCLTWAVLAVAVTACGNNNQQSTKPAQENKAAVEAPVVKEATPPPVQEVAPAEQTAPAGQQVPSPDDNQRPPADTPHN